jgi:ribosomal-protein-alanine N-acetyltransferase
MTTFLETQRLIIRAPTANDFDNWWSVHAESDVIPASKEIIHEWLDHHILDYKKHGFSMGSVYLKDSHEFIGRAGLFYYFYADNTEPDIEIGYVLHKAHWNKGFATELATALIDWGFKNLSVNKLIALIATDNKKSQHILEKVGMRYVKNIKSEGEDFLLYEINKQNK